jgi:hypothetical protein
MVPGQFRILGLPYEILELPPIFHLSRGSGFSAFSETHMDGVKQSNLQNCRRNYEKLSKTAFLCFYAKN